MFAGLADSGVAVRSGRFDEQFKIVHATDDRRLELAVNGLNSCVVLGDQHQYILSTFKGIHDENSLLGEHRTTAQHTSGNL